jgi:hypothetical protein
MHWARGILVAVLGALIASTGLFIVAWADGYGPQDIRTLAPAVEKRLKEWVVAWRAVLPGFSIAQFKAGPTSRGFLDGPWQTADLSDMQGDPLRALYVVSRDGRWMVNPYSGYTILHGSVARDVDTAVLLIDRKTSRQRQILYCGTACGFDDAAWITNDVFFVAGWGESNRKACSGGYWPGSPDLVSFDVKRNSHTWYFYAGPGSCRGIQPFADQKIMRKIPNVKP